MVSFFPTPYSDEILYSIISRYCLRSGNTSPKLVLKELFNSQNTIATADLPCNLSSLVENLRPFSNHTVEDLIYNHTLYSFYSTFLPPKRASLVMESMKAEYGGNIHSRVGIMASSINLPRYFRFCSECLREDQQKYGETYWHRLHQTPGVLVCLLHNLPLQESTVPFQGLNRHEYHASSVENCLVALKSKRYSNQTLEKLLLLAHDINWLMSERLSPKEPEWFYKRYVSLLIEKGLATAIGRVHQRRLLGDFVFFYGYEILEALYSSINYQEEHNWLFSIVRKHRKSFHPIRHLLLIRFLTNSIEEFFETADEYKPFGDAPWLCLNAAAAHYLNPVVSELVVTRCSETKKPVGTFSCSCGFIYCRTGPDQTEEDKHRIGKVKTYGSVWEQKLRELVEVERLGLRATARQLKVDPNTVKRYVSLLKLEASWQPTKDSELVESEEQPESHVDSADNIKLKHREKWKLLQQEHPETSKTTLRQIAPATYTWLYRHDKDWLNQNSPLLEVPVSSNNRVNWHKRDQLVLTQVKKAVQQLLKADKPCRVTISRIGKTLDLQALLEKHLDKMLLTKAYLDSVTEDVEDYQIRRIQWAIKKLEEQGEDVKLWKVIRMAALGQNYPEKVKAALEDELYKRPVQRAVS